MKNILIHGLGQNEKNWDAVRDYLKEKDMDVLCPDLFVIQADHPVSYEILYQEFSRLCNQQEGALNLCGLSLGGILALDFAKEYPEKVNSLILIGTPYQIPRILFKIQSLLFYLTPKSVFEKMGVSKKNFISLVNSMANHDIKQNIDKIKSSTLILCGEKDKVNLKSAKLLETNMERSRFQIVENSSHEVNRDNPKLLSELIFKFWEVK